VWGGVYELDHARLITAWRVFGDVTPLHRGAGVGVVADWQRQSQLMVLLFLPTFCSHINHIIFPQSAQYSFIFEMCE
jgi:hypothetical protein